MLRGPLRDEVQHEAELDRAGAQEHSYSVWLSLRPDFLIHRRPRAGIHLTYVGTTFRGALSLMVAGKEHAILLPKARGQMWTTSFYITVAGSVIAGVA